MRAMMATMLNGLLLCLFASSAIAEVPRFGLQLHLLALVRVTTPNQVATYTFSPGLTVLTGFTDSIHPGNRTTVRSGDGMFVAENRWPAISPEFGSFDELKRAIGNSGVWRIDVVDGVTQTLSSYEFTVDVGMLSANHLRPIRITSHVSGSSIPPQPLFTWEVDPDEPDGLVVSTSPPTISLRGPTQTEDVISPGSKFWAPARPILPGTYRFSISYDRSYTNGVVFCIPTTPTPLDGSPPLLAFDHHSYVRSGAVIVNLDAGSAVDCLGDFNNDSVPDSADLLYLISYFGATVPYDFPADLNLDRTVNTADLVAFLRRFGVPCRQRVRQG